MDLSCTIAVESEKDRATLLNIIANSFLNSVLDKGYLRVGINVMKLDKSGFHYDPENIKGAEDEWLDFCYRLELFPVEPTTPEVQRKMALDIIEVLESVGAKTKLLAEF